jgi:hypothetical protein
MPTTTYRTTSYGQQNQESLGNVSYVTRTGAPTYTTTSNYMQAPQMMKQDVHAD